MSKGFVAWGCFTHLVGSQAQVRISLCSNTPVVHCSFQLHTQQSTIGLYSLTLDSSLWCLSIRSVADWEGEDEDK